MLAQTATQETLVLVQSAAEGTPNEQVDDFSLSMDAPSSQLLVSTQRVETFTRILFDASALAPQTESLAGYAWDLDGDRVYEQTTVGPELEHAYEEKGIYTVRVLAVPQEGLVYRSEPIDIEVLNRAPVASILLPEGALFDTDAVKLGSASFDLDGSIEAWFWNFGDGSISTLQSPTHSYGTSGTYDVTLLVIDNDGRASAPSTQEVTIENTPPSVSFSAPSAVAIGATVQFTETSSDPSPGGSIIHVAWDFGDGTYAAGGPRADGIYRHTYRTSGTYNVTLYVIDNDGKLSTARGQVRVLGE
jgi:PKD repeat protein